MSGVSPAEKYTDLYEAWWPYVQRVASEILDCGADGEGVAQRIFRRLWTSGGWRTIDAPKGFFREAARKEALKVVSRRHGFWSLTEKHAAALPADDPDVVRQLIQRQCRDRLQEFLLRQPRKSAAVLIRTIIERMTRRETAEQLGITPDAVEKRITRAYPGQVRFTRWPLTEGSATRVMLEVVAYV